MHELTTAQEVEKEVRFAEDLRGSIKQEFQELAVLEMHLKPIGPHPIGMFEVEIFNPAQFGALIPWLVVHHGSLSILVHPNTGDSLRDHTQNAIWIGERLSLITSIFSRGKLEMDQLALKLKRLRDAEDAGEETA